MYYLKLCIGVYLNREFWFLVCQHQERTTKRNVSILRLANVNMVIYNRPKHVYNVIICNAVHFPNNCYFQKLVCSAVHFPFHCYFQNLVCSGVHFPINCYFQKLVYSAVHFPINCYFQTLVCSIIT